MQTACLERSRETFRSDEHSILTTLTHPALARPDWGRWFYAGMGLVVVLITFLGFAPTYYLEGQLPRPTRAPDPSTGLAVHAALFTGWIAFQLSQPWLIATRRVGLHRRLGWLGAGLGLGVWVTGNLVSAQAMNGGYREMGDPYAFYAVTFFSIQAFAVIVALGILWRRHGEAHKRLMLLSNAAILEAAIGRLPFLHIDAATAPFYFYLGADFIILAGAAFDLATRGRIHRVWWLGGGLLALSQVARVGIMHTEPWLQFARGVAGLIA